MRLPIGIKSDAQGVDFSDWAIDRAGAA
jgi:hypothetical protein